MAIKRTIKLKKKNGITRYGAMQRVRALWSIDPRRKDFDVLAALDDARENLHTAAFDQSSRSTRQEADFALRILQYDQSGMAEFLAPDLIQIARSYVRSANTIRR